MPDEFFIDASPFDTVTDMGASVGGVYANFTINLFAGGVYTPNPRPAQPAGAAYALSLNRPGRYGQTKEAVGADDVRPIFVGGGTDEAISLLGLSTFGTDSSEHPFRDKLGRMWACSATITAGVGTNTYDVTLTRRRALDVTQEGVPAPWVGEEESVTYSLTLEGSTGFLQKGIIGAPGTTTGSLGASTKILPGGSDKYYTGDISENGQYRLLILYGENKGMPSLVVLADFENMSETHEQPVYSASQTYTYNSKVPLDTVDPELGESQVSLVVSPVYTNVTNLPQYTSDTCTMYSTTSGTPVMKYASFVQANYRYMIEEGEVGGSIVDYKIDAISSVCAGARLSATNEIELLWADSTITMPIVGSASGTTSGSFFANVFYTGTIWYTDSLGGSGTSDYTVSVSADVSYTYTLRAGAETIWTKSGASALSTQHRLQEDQKTELGVVTIEDACAGWTGYAHSPDCDTTTTLTLAAGNTTYSDSELRLDNFSPQMDYRGVLLAGTSGGAEIRAGVTLRDGYRFLTAYAMVAAPASMMVPREDSQLSAPTKFFNAPESVLDYELARLTIEAEYIPLEGTATSVVRLTQYERAGIQSNRNTDVTCVNFCPRTKFVSEQGVPERIISLQHTQITPVTEIISLPFSPSFNDRNDKAQSMYCGIVSTQS